MGGRAREEGYREEEVASVSRKSQLLSKYNHLLIKSRRKKKKKKNSVDFFTETLSSQSIQNMSRCNLPSFSACHCTLPLTLVGNTSRTR